MSVETLITDVESALLRFVRWGLAWRRPEAADLAALVARPVKALPQWTLVYVIAEGVLYEWDAESTATEALPNVAKSSAQLPTDHGRWVRILSTLSYGAGRIPLAHKRDGYLRVVDSYASDDGPDATIERCFDNLPSVMIQFTGDEVKNQNNTPGTFYAAGLKFKLLVLSQNLRETPNATQGPRSAPEAIDDPGAYRIIGDLRRLLCGLAFDNGVEGVERVAIGNCALEFEDIDRRVYVWSMDVLVKTTFEIVDEDLEDLHIRAQPALTECPAPAFDRQNYVAVGGGLDEGKGPGLSRILDETVAVVAGVPVAVAAENITFAASSDTYRDLDNAGVWHFAVVAAGVTPALPVAGRMRVGVTRTDVSGVESDSALCSFSVPYGDAIDIT